MSLTRSDLLFLAGSNRVLSTTADCEILDRWYGAKLQNHRCLERLLLDIDRTIAPERASAALPYRITLQTDGDLALSCSARLLFRVLHSLIANTAKPLKRCSEPRIDVFATDHAGRLYVQVSDNGRGLSLSEQLWFAMCATGKLEATHGSWSDLPDMSLLLKSVGGRVKLIDTSRDGTRIGVSLPCDAVLREELFHRLSPKRTSPRHAL